MKSKRKARETINSCKKKFYTENILLTENDIIKEKKRDLVRNLRLTENYKKIEKENNKQRIANLQQNRYFKKKRIH